jgi:hypothetical protein
MIQQGFKDLYDNPSPQARAAEGEAANEMGLNGPRHAQDSMVAHVTPGEVVIPLSAQTPELMRYLSEKMGRNLEKYTVGSGYEQRNPTSGLPAFADRPLWEVKAEITRTLNAIVEKKLKLQQEKDPNQRRAIEWNIYQLEQHLEKLYAEEERIEKNSPEIERLIKLFFIAEAFD